MRRREGITGAGQLLDLLYGWGGRGEMEQIRLAFGTRDPGPAIRGLTQRGVVSVETSTQRGVGDKTEKVAVLAIPAEDAMTLVTPRRRAAPLRYSVTRAAVHAGRGLRQGAVLLHRGLHGHGEVIGKERHPDAGKAGGIPPPSGGGGGARPAPCAQ